MKLPDDYSASTPSKVTASVDDGGPAFPTHGSMGEVATYGMTLRDYFAGQALRELRMSDPAYDWKKLAERAYDYADAMLEARK